MSALPGADQVERARRLDGMEVSSGSELWPKIAILQRAGLIRLRWLEGKKAELRFVNPNRDVPK